MDSFDLLFGVATLILGTYAFAHTERTGGRVASLFLLVLGVLEIAAGVYF